MGALVGGDDVDVADAGDGVDRALGAEDDPALVDERLIEPAAEHLHGEQAVGGDAADHAAELVHVGVDHDAGAGGSLLRDDGAHAVVLDRGGEGLHLGDHDGADGILGAGRAGGVGEALEQGEGAVGSLLGGGGGGRGRGQGEQQEGQKSSQVFHRDVAHRGSYTKIEARRSGIGGKPVTEGVTDWMVVEWALGEQESGALAAARYPLTLADRGVRLEACRKTRRGWGTRFAGEDEVFAWRIRAGRCWWRGRRG